MIPFLHLNWYDFFSRRHEEDMKRMRLRKSPYIVTERFFFAWKRVKKDNESEQWYNQAFLRRGKNVGRIINDGDYYKKKRIVKCSSENKNKTKTRKKLSQPDISYGCRYYNVR